MGLYRKKPIVISAVQWDGTGESFNEITELNKDGNRDIIIQSKGEGSEDTLLIPTLEGDMKASLNDWIIKGISGEVYPCKPDIFEKTYEEVID